MNRVLMLAKKARGWTSPNPMVGALIVKGGEIIGEGFHARAGEPHAEIVALRKAGENARGGTMYVNLEPCCHRGRTPPCTDAILDAGIEKVVIGMMDPNPLVAGRGVKILQDGGLELVTGVLSDRAARLNEVFIKYITKELPFVVLKTAMTLDGKIATSTGESQWITGVKARERVHELRHRYDAILVGIGTVLADNPSLTCRLPAGGGKDPVRVVLDSNCRIPTDSILLTQKSHSPTIVAVTDSAPHENIERVRRTGAMVLKLERGKAGVDLLELMQELAKRKIASVLVEGGAQVAASFIQGELLDKVYWFIAPKIIGGHTAPGPIGGGGVNELGEALQLQFHRTNRYGEDICIEGYLKESRGR